MLTKTTLQSPHPFGISIPPVNQRVLVPRQPSPISLADVQDGWSAFHFVDNLTDEKYRLVDSRTGNLVLAEGDDYTASYDQTLKTTKGKKSIILARASELPRR